MENRPSDKVKRNLAAFLILLGLFIPCFGFPFATPPSPFDGLYGVKASVTQYEIVLKKGDFTAGEGDSIVKRYTTGKYEGRITLPYRYVLAAGVTLFFVGCGLLLFLKLRD